MKIISGIVILMALVTSRISMADEVKYFIQVEISGISALEVHDQNGFDKNGYHIDTGTKFDPDGYQKDGFNSDGFGRPECVARSAESYWNDYAGSSSNGLKFAYGGVFYGFHRGHTPYFDFGEYRYTKGILVESPGSRRLFEICRSKKKS